MADRQLNQRLALCTRLPTMAEQMEDVEVQSPTKTALTLWMAGSFKDVEQWMLQGSIPLTECAARWKGRYVGLRDTADHAANRHKQRCGTEGKSFDKRDLWLLKIELDSEAFVEMSTEKVNEPGRGCVTRLHYENSWNSGFDYGVWYYTGKPFGLNATGVKVEVFKAN